MNKFIIAGLSGILGAAAGAVGGYFLSRKKIYKEYEGFLEDQTRSTVAHYEKLVATLSRDLRESREGNRLLQEELENTLNGTVSMPGKAPLKRDVEGSPAIPRPLEKGKTDYTAFHSVIAGRGLTDDILKKYADVPVGDLPENQSTNPLVDPPPEDEPEEDDQRPMSKMDVAMAKADQEYERHNIFDESGPRIITREEFEELEEEGAYIQECITYYMADDSYCDEQEHLMPDYIEVLGNIDLAWRQKPIPTLVYVKNSKIGMIYEVSLHGGSYKEVVAGMYDEDISIEEAMRREETRTPLLMERAREERERYLREKDYAQPDGDPIDGDNDDLTVSLRERMDGVVPKKEADPTIRSAGRRPDDVR